jgi:hypothetical protein
VEFDEAEHLFCIALGALSVTDLLFLTLGRRRLLRASGQ